MTDVNCELSRCTGNSKGKCTLNEIDLVESYGRSTDYTHEFMCDNYDTKSKVNLKDRMFRRSKESET